MAMDYQSLRYAMLNTPIELGWHLRRVERHLAPGNGDRILEVGCGRGFLTRLVQEIAPATQGVDLNAEAVRNGVTRNLRVMDAERLDFPDSSFDKLYCIHAIEHFPRPELALAEMARVLRPGGKILLVYPAEPVRGLYVVPTAMLLFGNPFRARELHLHRLTPRRVRRLAVGLPLEHITSRFSLLLTPQFLTVFRRPAATS